MSSQFGDHGSVNSWRSDAAAQRKAGSVRLNAVCRTAQSNVQLYVAQEVKSYMRFWIQLEEH